MATVFCNHVQFNAIQALVFDKDGTLANSEAYLLQVGLLRLKFLEAHFPGVSSSLFQVLGFTPESVHPAGALAVDSRAANEQLVAAHLEQLGQPYDEALQISQLAFTQATQALANTELGRKAICTPLIPGCLELLHQAIDCGLKIAVISSDTTANVQDFLHHYELSSLVTLGVGADRGLTKPDPRLLQQTCQALEVLPQQTLVIGDAESDFRMARSAQAAGAIGVTWGWQQCPPFHSADVTLHHPASLKVHI